MFKVDKNVPQFQVKGLTSKIIEFLKTLEDGDSFILGDAEDSAIRSRASYIAMTVKKLKLDFEISTAKTSEGLRLWVNKIDE